MTNLEPLSWEPALELGIAAIDAQHQALFAEYNAMCDAFIAEAGAEQLNRMFIGLVDHIETHFRDEEALMRQLRHPEFGSHRAEHQRLLEQVREVRDRAKQGQVVLTLQMLSFLRGWVRDHILNEDSKILTKQH
ncbi:bacteriohemerythrin [Motiliproteus sediminis]|uniref:bacteriohemerythrin n=1 Tax=Motiliproteus sediminis TaxID=1468178 RepID=UPI001AEFDC5D|nr:hemerythrin family protein [Motiliproteus sediminis]